MSVSSPIPSPKTVGPDAAPPLRRVGPQCGPAVRVVDPAGLELPPLEVPPELAPRFNLLVAVERLVWLDLSGRYPPDSPRRGYRAPDPARAQAEPPGRELSAQVSRAEFRRAWNALSPLQRLALLEGFTTEGRLAHKTLSGWRYPAAYLNAIHTLCEHLKSSA